MQDGQVVLPVLFLEKVLLRRIQQPLRGVELFNLALVRDLLRLGYPVSVIADRSWKARFNESFARKEPEVSFMHFMGFEPANLLATALKAGRRRCNVLLIGNVGSGLVPVIRQMRRRDAFLWYVLIAHRETSARFLSALKGAPGHVVAVNRKIAEPFERAGFPSVNVDYGVTNAELYYPGSRRKDELVNFCLVGMLDNAWKGADTAVEAFRLMKEETRRQCVLHLASFSKPPSFPEDNIRSYSWMPVEKIPDLLRQMDVMLCPSRDENVMRETFSQAMVQGMLTGLPVITSDRPVLTEKLDRGGGHVYHDVRELSALMEKLARDPAARAELGKQGRAVALERYVWDSERFALRYLARPPTG